MWNSVTVILDRQGRNNMILMPRCSKYEYEHIFFLAATICNDLKSLEITKKKVHLSLLPSYAGLLPYIDSLSAVVVASPVTSDDDVGERVFVSTMAATAATTASGAGAVGSAYSLLELAKGAVGPASGLMASEAPCSVPITLGSKAATTDVESTMGVDDSVAFSVVGLTASPFSCAFSIMLLYCLISLTERSTILC